MILDAIRIFYMTVITITIANTAADPDKLNVEQFIEYLSNYVEAVNDDLTVCRSEVSKSEEDLWTALGYICPDDSAMSVPSLTSITQHNSKLRLIQGGKK